MNKIDLINCLFLKVITLEDSKIDKDCWQKLFDRLDIR